MQPVLCRVKHDPENGKHGDCVRACVASIMGLDAEVVPHFYHDNCDGLTASRRISDWLGQHGFAPFYTAYDGSWSKDEVLQVMGEQNPTAVYMLFGATQHGHHVVVCRGGEVVHDPAWSRSPLVRAGDTGYWSVMCIARI